MKKHIRIPRVAAINDISGFGRCSLTTCIPVLSVMGVQCCPVPTAVLSMHTGFDEFVISDMTSFMPSYLKSWEKMSIPFDAVFSGFLGSYEQIRITEDFMRTQKKNNPEAILIVDTVMGDGGSLYATYSDEMCEEIKRLVSIADVVTPNVTEACRLTSTTYTGDDISCEQAEELCRRILQMGASAAVVTGIKSEGKMSCAVHDNSSFSCISNDLSCGEFSGNGDLFASILIGKMMCGCTLCEACTHAADFVFKAIEYTLSLGSPISDGIAFEPILHTLA